MRTLLIGLCAAVLGAMFAVSDAEAKRLGGGRSVGTQRSVTTPPASTPAKPAQQQAAPGAQQAAPGAAAPASGLSRWMPILGGLAIGGLLGSMFGGSGFGGILLLALLAIGAVVAFKAFARRREESASQQSVQFAGMGGRETLRVPPASSLSEASFQRQETQAATIPAGFDTAGFLRGAKLNFNKLQAANDAGHLDEIRELATQEMFDELSKDVRTSAGGGRHTDVVSLNADLLQVATEGDKHWASVRFSGMVREAPGTAPVEFQEVWNLVKPADGSSGWLLAGIQQMQ
jgi:predicted lipid-binding transport protein (Tim44 family)